MGDILSCLSTAADVAGAASSASDVVDAAMLAQIAEIAAQQAQDFPDVFREQKELVLWEMKNAAPNAWKDETFHMSLTHDKSSEAEINELSLKLAGGESTKGAVEEAIHVVIDPQIEEKCPDPVSRKAAEVAADKAIEAAAEKAVNAALEKLSDEIAKNPEKWRFTAPEGGKPSGPKKHKKGDKKGDKKDKKDKKK